ncbi:AarF/ABC1/UbiB kinase family protein [Nocardioidaceae bacterium SCSIO 66511]|nr:AarF/ABC1/UbiB kinase family protein [Nocardioidaceae bacterium SCSIO 66511]
MTPSDRSEDPPHRSVPRSTAARTARLARLPLGLASRATVGLGRRLSGTPASSVMTDLQQRTAEQIFEVLGDLKGGAMKFGQTLSIFEAAMPEELSGPYRETLAKLQDSAPPMPAATVHRVLADAFGPDWRTRLVELDDDPAAAASIGQVHRGKWHDGTDVAVKVQYPGAGPALESDLRQIGRLSRLFGVITPGLDVKPLVQELKDRVVEELDYDLEAQAQQAFAEAFAGDEAVKVPRVVDHATTVLVSEWMDSKSSLARLIADGSKADRDHYGAAYVRFLFAGPGRTGMLHADPHPGNFRVLDDGRLGVVDYGAVARLPEGGLPAVVGRLLRHAVDDDWDAVRDGLVAEGFIRPETKLDTDTMRAYLAPFVEPAQTPTFTFSRDWLRAQANRVSSPQAQGLGTALKINIPPSYLLIHRVWAGGIGVLSQLGATAPFREILEQSLPGFDDC